MTIDNWPDSDMTLNVLLHLYGVLHSLQVQLQMYMHKHTTQWLVKMRLS